MKRILVIASHHNMAEGLRDSLNFVSGGMQEVIALAAYVDNSSIDERVEMLMNSFDEEDELVILTDMMAGSVNQKFIKYRNRPHTHLVSGMNLPLAFVIALEPQGKYISAERMREIVESAKNEIKYVNDMTDDGDEDDE